MSSSLDELLQSSSSLYFQHFLCFHSLASNIVWMGLPCSLLAWLLAKILAEISNGCVALWIVIQQFFWGSWVTGKERIFLEVGKVLKKYIYVGAVKRRLLDCMDLSEEDKKWLTIRDQESHIHVVPLWSIASFKRMSSISHHYHVLI